MKCISCEQERDNVNREGVCICCSEATRRANDEKGNWVNVNFFPKRGLEVPESRQL